jgi:DNA-binding transcriptional regulator YiaG
LWAASTARIQREWEQGKTPSDIASRFMDEIQRNPEYWRQRLKEAIKTKAC